MVVLLKKNNQRVIIIMKKIYLELEKYNFEKEEKVNKEIREVLKNDKELKESIKKIESDIKYLEDNSIMGADNSENIQVLNKLLLSSKRGVEENSSKKNSLENELHDLYLLSSRSNWEFESKKKLDNKNVHLKDEKKIVIITSFSGQSNIINKEVSRMFYKKVNNNKGMRVNDLLIANENDYNRKDSFSLSASTIFMELKKFEKYLYKDLGKFSLNLYNNLIPINIENFFLVSIDFKNDEYRERVYIYPDGKRINMHLLNLNYFSLLLRILSKLSMNKKESKLAGFPFRDYIKSSLFVFHGYNWSTILKKLKGMGFDVSGGKGVNRHIVNLMDFKLSLFISKLSNNPYNDIVISNHLVNKELYLSNPGNKVNIVKDVSLESIQPSKDKNNLLNDLPSFISSSDINMNSPLDMFYKILENKIKSVEVCKNEELLSKLKVSEKNIDTGTGTGTDTHTEKNDNVILHTHEHNTNESNNDANYSNEYKTFIQKQEEKIRLFKLREKEGVIEKKLDQNENSLNTNLHTSSDSFKWTNKTNVASANLSELGKRKYHTSLTQIEDNKNEDTLQLVNIKSSISESDIKPLISSTELNRINFLDSGSKLAVSIKEIVGKISNNSSEEEKIDIQKKLERLCLDHERNYLKILIKSLVKDNSVTSSERIGENFTLSLKQKIVSDWELTLNKSLANLIQPLIKNQYSNLIMEVKKGNSLADFYLLVLAIDTSIVTPEKEILNENKKTKVIKNIFNNGNLLNIVLSIIIRLLASHEEKIGWGNIKQSSLIMKISSELIKRLPKEFPVLFFRKNDKKSILINEYYKNNVLNMSEESKGIVGNTFLDLILSTVDILSRSNPIYDSVDKKRHNYISISSEYRDNLIERSFNPIILPMVAKPVEWEETKKDGVFKSGGYLTDEMKQIVSHNSFIHQKYKNLENSIGGSVQIECINFINQQKYKINKIMLDFLLDEFKNDNSYFFKGFNKKHPLTNRIADLNKQDVKNVLAHNSKYTLNRNILELALIFENINFYIPSYMDFRGRIYPYPHYLEYQGLDTARCLIEFANGCEINNSNIEVVYQYLANTAGNSKFTIEKKIKWSIDFLNNLNNIDTDIMTIFKNKKVQEIVNNSDEPGQFLSVLTSLVMMKSNLSYTKNERMKFNTPICFDATCSGMQHLSALFSDVDIAIKSNVIGNDDEIPQDVYKEIADTVIDTIDNEKDEDLKSVLSNIIINRKLMKKPVMTVPYNVGLNTMTEQLIGLGYFSKVWETLDKGKTCFYIVNPEFVKPSYPSKHLKLSSYEMGKLSSILHKSVYIKFPSLKLYKDYLDGLIQVILKLNKPIIWITPAGMKISLSYQNFENVPSKSLFLKRRGASISLPKTTLNIKENKQSFMPNFIHSMDAANIQLLVQKLITSYGKKNINLFTIHDCFASTPDFMSIINNEVKLTFIELYFNTNYIDEMHNNFLKQIQSFTEIFSEIEYKEDIKINKYYIVVKNKRVYIPNKPTQVNWLKNKQIFIEGIRKSLYFIN